MITTVLLDLDDTILDFHKAEKEALKKALQKVGVEPTEELLAGYSEINSAKSWSGANRRIAGGIQ